MQAPKSRTHARRYFGCRRDDYELVQMRTWASAYQLGYPFLRKHVRSIKEASWLTLIRMRKSLTLLVTASLQFSVHLLESCSGFRYRFSFGSLLRRLNYNLFEEVPAGPFAILDLVFCEAGYAKVVSRAPRGTLTLGIPKSARTHVQASLRSGLLLIQP